MGTIFINKLSGLYMRPIYYLGWAIPPTTKGKNVIVGEE
jgi:hypothetical protein